MKTKKKPLGVWIGSGSCFALAVALLGVSYPKSGKIEELQKELDRLTPLVEEIRKQDRPKKEAQTSSKLDAERAALLPAEEKHDTFLDFHNMAQKCAVDAGVGPIRYYRMHPADYWPAKPGIEPKTVQSGAVPSKYGEKPGETSSLRRFPLELDFESDFPSLLRFVGRLHQLPRFCQVVSVHAEASGAMVKVVVLVEAYGIKVSR